MKGLLKKDLFYIIEQKYVFIFILLFMIAIFFVNDEKEDVVAGALTGYVTIVSIFIGVSTFSYDEQNRGMLQILSMPVTKKMYVQSKYIICSITGIAGAIITTVLNFAVVKISDIEQSPSYVFLICGTSIVICMFIISIAIPAYIKMTAQKAMAVVMSAVMAIVLAIMFFIYISEKSGINIEVIIENALEREKMSIMLLAFITGMICVTLSYWISLKFVEKREF